MKKINKMSLFLITVLAMIACNSEPTLQSYYVDNQEKENFVVVDVPTSLFIDTEMGNLSEDNKKALKSIRKANLLALPVSNENQEQYESEKAVVEKILKDDKYKLLMKFGLSGRNVKVMYLGEEQAIDEIILYANDDEKGFALARLLGDDMNIAAFTRLMKSAANGNLDLNMEAFGDFGKEVGEKMKNKKNDSINIGDNIKVKVEREVTTETEDSVN